jgi:predicted metalloprotease
MVRFDRSTAEKGAKYVEDRRGSGGRRTRAGGGGGRGMAVGGGGIGIVILALVIAMCGGPNLLSSDGTTGAIDLGGGGSDPFGTSSAGFDELDVSTSGDAAGLIDCDVEIEACMSALMFDIQDTWDAIFDEAGAAYQTTSLVLFDGAVNTGCGRATSAVGPFYCPAPNDQKVYIDLGFFNELATRFGAPGDFAQSYVLAHEVGHHIQSITGTSDAVRQAQANDPSNKNEYSIRQELQADCYAGVWAHSANQRQTRDTGVDIFEPGDIEEGLRAAAAVGDDRIQEQAGMTVDPHTWTHGSAEQRMRWFSIGFDEGDPTLCDPFAVDNP